MDHTTVLVVFKKNYVLLTKTRIHLKKMTEFKFQLKICFKQSWNKVSAEKQTSLCDCCSMCSTGSNVFYSSLVEAFYQPRK